MMRTEHTTKGFTLTEVLVVIAILAVIAAVSVTAFRAMYSTSALRAAKNEIYGSLTAARTNTLASRDDTTYGVHLGTSSVIRFEGGTYTAGSASNRTYTFEGGVTATGTLITTGTDIVFARLSGEPSAEGTIYVRDRDGLGTTTVTVHASGLVEAD